MRKMPLCSESKSDPGKGMSPGTSHKNRSEPRARSYDETMPKSQARSRKPSKTSRHSRYRKRSLETSRITISDPPIRRGARASTSCSYFVQNSVVRALVQGNKQKHLFIRIVLRGGRAYHLLSRRS